MNVHHFHLMCAVVVSLAGLLSISAAPLAANQKGTMVSKRQGEVIFFEKARNNRAAKSKRSEAWPILADKAAQPAAAADHQSQVASNPPKSKQGSSESEVKQEAEAKMLTKELEEWALDEALDYLVDKIIEEAYEEKIEEMESQSTTADKLVADSKQDQTTPKLMEASKKLVLDSEDSEGSDNQADALARLIAKQKAKLNHLPPAVETKAGNSGFSPEVEAAVDPAAVKASKQVHNDKNKAEGELSDELAMGSTQEPTVEEPEDADELRLVGKNGASYSAGDVLKYFEYLQRLQMMEDSFRDGFKGFKDNKAAGDAEAVAEGSKKLESGTKIRKRRSVSDWASEGQNPASKGVWFNPEEIDELKGLLLGLAKDRLQSQKIIKYLVDESESSSVVPGDTIFQPREEQYPMTAQDRNSVENLAYKLGQQQSPPLSYPGYRRPAAKRFGYWTSSMMK